MSELSETTPMSDHVERTTKMRDGKTYCACGDPWPCSKAPIPCNFPRCGGDPDFELHGGCAADIDEHMIHESKPDGFCHVLDCHQYQATAKRNV